MATGTLKNSQGQTILPLGDPNYQDLVIGGSPTPENQLLSTLPTEPLTQTILTTFNIPFNTPVLGSPLEGYDVRNLDPIPIMKLSLESLLINNQFAEVELDEFGIARFYIVGQNPANNLDIRYCVPTSQFRNPADLVIIRGYKPPPQRQLRPAFDGLKNKNVFDYINCAQGTCEESFTARYATVSYDDPQLDQVYLDDIRNSYELKAFESLLGYLIDLHLPDGINTIPGLKITFGDTTKEYVKIPITFLNTPNQASVGPIFVPFQRGTLQVINGVTAIFTVADQTALCNFPLEKLVGNIVRLPNSSFLRLNKYGLLESDFVGVVDVVFGGNKITQFKTTPGGAGLNASLVWIVKRRKDLITLQHGKNWVWKYAPDGSGDILLYFYTQIDTQFAKTICNLYNNPTSIASGLNKAVDLAVFFADDLFTPVQSSSSTIQMDLACNIGDALGYYVPSGQMCVLIERKRPSIDVFDPNGGALALAQQITVTYTPIVIVDFPAPIAYASTKAALISFDGAKNLPPTGIIDQADGIVDADPTTTQVLQDSQLSTLQDNTNGATIDISLPFADATQCQTIAQNILALQTQIIDTKSLVLGPTSTPHLGDLVSDGSIVNEIQYSYSDGGQYLITVTAGPRYLTVGSFNNSRYQIQYEEVTREGLVVQDKGNGAEYVVRLSEFGELTCVSMVLDDIYVGDKVNVKIFNNPVERL